MVMVLEDYSQMTLISTHPVKKGDLGFHGNLFGGKLLAWCDAAGAALATQIADTPRMVTVLIDECLFNSKHSSILYSFLINSLIITNGEKLCQVHTYMNHQMVVKQ